MSGELLKHALTVAQSQLGVREHPPGSNRGPEVDEYLKGVGLNPAGNGKQGYAWCAAFVYYCYARAAEHLQIANPAVKTAGSLMQWNGARRRGLRRISAVTAQRAPGVIEPGMVFVMDFGGGKGHTGVVESVDAGKGTITTIEGNTNDEGSREGYEVARRVRPIKSINVGFIDYGQKA